MGSSVEQNILVTGGAGFIGTHTVVQLLNQGFKVTIIDNLDNSVVEAVHRVRELVGPDLSNKLEFNLVSTTQKSFDFLMQLLAFFERNKEISFRLG